MLAGAEARGRAYASAAVEAWPYTEPGLLGAISHAIRPVRGRTDSAIRILLAWPGFTLRGQHLTGGVGAQLAEMPRVGAGCLAITRCSCRGGGGPPGARIG